MPSNRLEQVQSNLNMAYEQLACRERAMILAEESEKMRIEQQIRVDWTRIHKFERDYTATLAQQIRRQQLPEPIAETITAEIIDEVEILASFERDEEVKGLLQQILQELQQPDSPASAKLKVALPIIPNIITYELEGDTENVVRRLFPTFSKMYDGLKTLTSKNNEKK